MFMKHYAPNRFEPSIEVIMKMGVQWGGGGWGCQGGCERERRIEVFVKMEKKIIWGSGGGGGGRVVGSEGGGCE